MLTKIMPEKRMNRYNECKEKKQFDWQMCCLGWECATVNRNILPQMPIYVEANPAKRTNIVTVHLIRPFLHSLRFK